MDICCASDYGFIKKFWRCIIFFHYILHYITGLCSTAWTWLIEDAVDQWLTFLCDCVPDSGRHFEHTL